GGRRYDRNGECAVRAPARARLKRRRAGACAREACVRRKNLYNARAAVSAEVTARHGGRRSKIPLFPDLAVVNASLARFLSLLLFSFLCVCLLPAARAGDAFVGAGTGVKAT